MLCYLLTWPANILCCVCLDLFIPLPGIKSFPRALQLLSGSDAAVECVGIGPTYATEVLWSVDGVQYSSYPTGVMNDGER